MRVCIQAAGVVVNGNHSPLNLTLVKPRSPRDVTDEEPEVTRRRKAELMTSLRLADSGGISGGGGAESQPEVDWDGEHLLYEPSKRPRTEAGEEEEELEEEKTQSDDSVKKGSGMTSLLGVLAVCSFTDVYNSYQRRLATAARAPGNTADRCSTGSGLSAAEVDDHVVEDRKSLTESRDSCNAPLDVELSSTAATPAANGLYPLAARFVLNRVDESLVLKHTHTGTVRCVSEYFTPSLFAV